MTEARATEVRLYVATSVDGFIADHEGGVDWLDNFEPSNYGFDEFTADVGVVVMGRRTYELVRMMGVWPYAGKSVLILTSRPLRDLPPGTGLVGDGIAAAIAKARGMTAKDIWIVGGTVTMRSALEAGLVDRAELFIVPVLLGSGLTLLGSLSRRKELSFDNVETFPDGVVKLAYRVQRDKTG